MKSIDRNGYECEGDPEPLKSDLSGFRSVKIDQKNQIVFRINGNEILFTSTEGRLSGYDLTAALNCICMRDECGNFRIER